MTQDTQNTPDSIRAALTPEPTNRVLTLPNAISFCRLLLIPVYFFLLLKGHNLAAGILFAIAAATDWLDGLIARTTNSVSKIGQWLDPAVDRLLNIFGVIGLYIVARIPFWILALVLLRDVIMLFGYFIMLKRFDIRVEVVLLGKLATALLYFGFFLLLINMPTIPGLAILTLDQFPGFTSEPVSLGIWFVYAGVILAIFTTTYYVVMGMVSVQNANSAKTEDK